jgi:drug/metabolite transporter (DMT)-like permease
LWRTEFEPLVPRMPGLTWVLGRWASGDQYGPDPDRGPRRHLPQGGFPRWLFAGCGIAWIVYLGLAPTALGFATWAYALRRMSAGRLASLAYLIPVVAVALGWVLVGETPPWLAAVGGALCLAGVALARRR